MKLKNSQKIEASYADQHKMKMDMKTEWKVHNVYVHDLEETLNRLEKERWHIWPQTIQVTSRGENPTIMVCVSHEYGIRHHLPKEK